MITPAIVQQTALTNAQNKTTTSLTLNGVIAGNTVFALVAYDDSNNTSSIPASMSDSVAGAMTRDIQQIRSHNSAAIYSSWNAAAGTHTVTTTAASGAAGNWSWLLLEVFGLGAINSLDQTGAVNGTTQSSAVSTSGAIVQPVEFALAMCESGGAVSGYVTPSQNGGWNNLGILNSSFPSGSFASLLTSAAGVLSPTFGTLSGAGFAAVIATYQSAAIPVGTQLM